MPHLPDLSQLSDVEKDALILALFQRLETAERRIVELEAKLGEPPKTPDNSSLPPSKGQKPNQAEKAGRSGSRQGSLGRRGGGRLLDCDPDETVIVKVVACVHCRAALGEADQVLHGRYDRIDLPVVRQVVTAWNVTPGAADAAAAPFWRRCPRAWRRARRLWCNLLASLSCPPSGE